MSSDVHARSNVAFHGAWFAVVRRTQMQRKDPCGRLSGSIGERAQQFFFHLTIFVQAAPVFLSPAMPYTALAAVAACTRGTFGTTLSGRAEV